ncbi:MAG: fibrillarin-like rRNA/tRNA 2'-O-methyltransferase [Candidatus Aenigmarchaeota archaeon]|nr:fibrillarin-like rRNA/tRNA 2'-O-methyltransferase [Candidatus Aenigmarchaeota archaeon]
MKEIFPGIYQKDDKLYTLNLRSGQRVYGEKLFRLGGKEYREWIPFRSKLAAAIKNGIREVPLRKGMKVLYLGSATGTTVSHISDIVGEDGIIFCVEFSERMMREFLKVASRRPNLVPILGDARKINDYKDTVENVDLVYCDIAQPDATEVLIRNAKKFLNPGGYVMLVVKSRSVDISKSPSEIYKEEIKKLKDAGIDIIDWVKLDPYEKDHAFILGKF